VEALAVLRQAISTRSAAFLVCDCDVSYQGRARSFLDRGERMIILKGDGTLIIHTKEGRNPVNWMPPGTRTTARIDGGTLLLRSRSRGGGETLEVRIYSTTLAQNFNLRDFSRIEIYGREKDFVKELLENPSVIEKGFRLTRSERVTMAGSIDISGVDSCGRPVAVEVKRSKASPQDVIQLKRYVDSLRKKTDAEVRGILLCPSISANARRMLREYGFELRRIDPLKVERKPVQSDLSSFVGRDDLADGLQ